jgi:hypothetical protein
VVRNFVWLGRGFDVGLRLRLSFFFVAYRKIYMDSPTLYSSNQHLSFNTLQVLRMESAVRVGRASAVVNLLVCSTLWVLI